MTASHTFTEPHEIVAKDDVVDERVVDEEYLSHCVWSQARALMLMPGADLAAERKLIDEAREFLNGALAKIDRHFERLGMGRLPMEETHVH